MSKENKANMQEMQEELFRHLQNPDLDHLEDAKSGDIGPLADHIENGGELSAETRKFLSEVLRRDFKRPRGGTRTKEKKMSDYRIWRAVCEEMRVNDIGSEKAYVVLAAKTGIPSETIRSAFKRIDPT